MNGVFTKVSSGITPLLGYSQRDFLQNFETYLTDNPINQQAAEHTARSIEGIPQEPYLVELTASNGDAYLCEIRERPIFFHNDRVVSVAGIVLVLQKQ